MDRTDKMENLEKDSWDRTAVQVSRDSSVQPGKNRIARTGRWDKTTEYLEQDSLDR
jgi:hypothetical protein